MVHIEGAAVGIAQNGLYAVIVRDEHEALPTGIIEAVEVILKSFHQIIGIYISVYKSY